MTDAIKRENRSRLTKHYEWRCLGYKAARGALRVLTSALGGFAEDNLITASSLKGNNEQIHMIMAPFIFLPADTPPILLSWLELFQDEPRNRLMAFVRRIFSLSMSAIGISIMFDTERFGSPITCG